MINSFNRLAFVDFKSPSKTEYKVHLIAIKCSLKTYQVRSQWFRSYQANNRIEKWSDLERHDDHKPHCEHKHEWLYLFLENTCHIQGTHKHWSLKVKLSTVFQNQSPTSVYWLYLNKDNSVTSFMVYSSFNNFRHLMLNKKNSPTFWMLFKQFDQEFSFSWAPQSQQV